MCRDTSGHPGQRGSSRSQVFVTLLRCQRHGDSCGHLSRLGSSRSHALISEPHWLVPGRPGLGSLDRGAICPRGANWVLPPDTLGPGPGVPTGHCCPFDLNTEQPKGCEGGAAPRGPGNVGTQSPRGWGLHPSLGLPPTRPRRPTALWAWRSVVLVRRVTGHNKVLIRPLQGQDCGPGASGWQPCYLVSLRK